MRLDMWPNITFVKIKSIQVIVLLMTWNVFDVYVQIGYILFDVNVGLLCEYIVFDVGVLCALYLMLIYDVNIL